MTYLRAHAISVTTAAVCAAALLVNACTTPKTSEAAETAAAGTGAAGLTTPDARLWGEMTPVVSVKELMRDLLDPLADNIFEAVAVVIDQKRTIENTPTTDDDWDRIRIGATAMAEGAYLLKVRRPFTPPGDENNSQGPEAVELSPAAITAKVQKDPVEWNARIEALRNVGLQVLDIVKRKDTAELWDAAENLDQACEACHRSYWYPGETLDYYRKLDRRLGERLERKQKAKDEAGAARPSASHPAAGSKS
ncbi:MAG: hypothetical protein AB7O32_17910 [Vicinamibacterales bacterium]